MSTSDGETAGDEPHLVMDETPEPEDELEAFKNRLKAVEEEAKKLEELTSESAAAAGGGSGGSVEPGSAEEVDSRSVFVGGVDYSATLEEIQAHFQSCGVINRVTILCDRSGHPKGYAYVEFADKESVSNAVALNESLFHGRPIKVVPKRTNVPGMSRGRGRGRGAYRAVPMFYAPPMPFYYGPVYRGGPRGGRGRGRGRGYAPY